jgi:hypothetical protein
MQRPAGKVKQGFFWSLLLVMAGLVPAIHVLFSRSEKTWMPATSASMAG